ncbi:hypothetical protein D3C80_669560 [compost metagenome]
MGHWPQPRVIDFDPASRGKPLHAIDLKAPHLPRVIALMGAVPVLDAVIDPAVKAPEHRIHMGRERVAEKVVFCSVPAPGKIGRITGKRHRRAVDRIARHRGPAHVQPIVQVHFQLRAERPEGQSRQVQRVLVLRLPDLEVAAERLAGLDRRHPLPVGIVARRPPAWRYAVAVVIVVVARKALAVELDARLRQGEMCPRRQVLH